MKSKFFFIAFSLAILNSCSTNFINLDNGKKIDSRLVGTWIGSEKDKQIEGAEKSWEMVRKSDGTFVLDFQFTVNGRTRKHIETGNWWIEKGKFHEFHNESEKTDIYKYEVLDANKVKFKSEFISVEMNTESYEFIDTRK